MSRYRRPGAGRDHRRIDRVPLWRRSSDGGGPAGMSRRTIATAALALLGMGVGTSCATTLPAPHQQNPRRCTADHHERDRTRGTRARVDHARQRDRRLDGHVDVDEQPTTTSITTTTVAGPMSYDALHAAAAVLAATTSPSRSACGRDGARDSTSPTDGAPTGSRSTQTRRSSLQVSAVGDSAVDLSVAQRVASGCSIRPVDEMACP